MIVIFNRDHLDPGNCVYSAGAKVDIPDATARHMIHHGIATPFIERPALHAEKAIVRKPKRKEKR